MSGIRRMFAKISLGGKSFLNATNTLEFRACFVRIYANFLKSFFFFRKVKLCSLLFGSFVCSRWRRDFFSWKKFHMLVVCDCKSFARFKFGFFRNNFSDRNGWKFSKEFIVLPLCQWYYTIWSMAYQEQSLRWGWFLVDFSPKASAQYWPKGHSFSLAL